MLSLLASAADDSCIDFEEYFTTHCPVALDDYDGCCLCTQYYYYGCSCCLDIVEEVGVMGDCAAIGEPSGDYDFCYM